MLRIVVGSTNPVKVGAVAEAFRKYWSECEVVGIGVRSGVGEQPMSELETMRGARNRAMRCIRNADYGVGLEGGVCTIENKMFECAWVAIIDKDGKLGLAGGLYFELPANIAEEIRKGGELGPLMDKLTGKSNVKQGAGAIGIFTKGELDRKAAYVQIVLSALIKFVSPEWFD